jgi:hypothetical protein
MPEAIAALESDQTVLVSSGEWIVFSPQGASSPIGIIIYPGGHVDARAYAPLARELASDGNLVIIPRMPLNTPETKFP